MAPAQFDHDLRMTPTGPGVYLMRDADGGLLYLGKAASLRNQLRSYFGSRTGSDPKVRFMVSKVAD
ncbi:MAG: nucleotide excision repair endonuclease [Chloroflexota bacterium]|nr:nucleotide excision repair endonuclease [Chloroflexota bacterium]